MLDSVCPIRFFFSSSFLTVSRAVLRLSRPRGARQSYLTESRFRPRKLKKEKKSGLVDTISAMEASYPADANPLGDPALSGQWSVVYSSSSKVSVSYVATVGVFFLFAGSPCCETWSRLDVTMLLMHTR